MLARAELIRRRNDFCVVAMIAPHLVVERYDSESSTLGLFFKLESALLASVTIEIEWNVHTVLFP